jgi:4-aminobutyrate aminotransferase/(S)-3-amino-2-methylpropionate transaminase
LETIEREQLVRKAQQIEAAAMRRLGALANVDSVVGEVRGRGAMLAVEFVQPGIRVPAPQTARQVASQCHSEGVLVLVCGTFGNVVRLLPPLVISHELLSDGLDVLERAIKEAW